MICKQKRGVTDAGREGFEDGRRKQAIKKGLGFEEEGEMVMAAGSSRRGRKMNEQRGFGDHKDLDTPETHIPALMPKCG